MKIDKNIGVLISIIFLITIAIVIPIYLVFGNSEITNTEIQFQNNLYNTLFISGAIMTLIGFYALQIWRSNNKLGDSIGFHNIGEEPSSKIFKNWTHPQLYLASLLIISLLFFIAQSFGFDKGTGLRILPQQFSKTDSLIYATLQIPASENIFFAGSLFVIIFLIQFLFIRLKINIKDYKFYIYSSLILLGGTLAWILHLSVYGSSQVAGLIVFTFWSLQAFLMLWTGSFYPALALHQVNNFLISFKTLYSNDAVLLTMIFIWLSLGGLYYFLYNPFKKEKNKDILV